MAAPFTWLPRCGTTARVVSCMAGRAKRPRGRGLGNEAGFAALHVPWRGRRRHHRVRVGMSTHVSKSVLKQSRAWTTSPATSRSARLRSARRTTSTSCPQFRLPHRSGTDSPGTIWTEAFKSRFCKTHPHTHAGISRTPAADSTGPSSSGACVRRFGDTCKRPRGEACLGHT
jgi:hypothetical protein